MLSSCFALYEIVLTNFNCNSHALFFWGNLFFLLYFFYYVVIYFAVPFELMWFKNYKLLLFFKNYYIYIYIWLFLHFYSIFYIVFCIAGSWILMNKLRLCVNLINLFFKFLLFKNQKGCRYVPCDIFLNYITWKQEHLSLTKNKSWNHK